MSKEGMVPKVRFYNFNDEWFIKSLEEISEIIMGQSPKSEYYTDNPSDYILVQGNADIKNGSVVPRAYTSKPTKLAEKGNIILTVRAPVGEVAKTDYEVVLGRGVSSLKGNEFLYQKLLMMNKVNYWEKFSTGSTFQSINSNDIRNAKLLVPIAEEQQKIGDLFEKLDQAISLQQQVLETTKEYKQSMLKKMFPKKGEKVPEIRFKGFSNAWMEYKLGKIADVSNGKMNTQDAIENGKYPFYIRSSEIKRSDKYLYNEEAILTPGEGKIGEVLHYVKGKYSAHQRVYRIFNFKNVDAIFILYHMSIHFKRHALKDNSQATAPSIRMGTLTSYPIRIPSLEEQQKIGSFFKTLDEKIEQEEKKLEIYESMKKALMQRMFV